MERRKSRLWLKVTFIVIYKGSVPLSLVTLTQGFYPFVISHMPPSLVATLASLASMPMSLLTDVSDTYTMYLIGMYQN